LGFLYLLTIRIEIEKVMFYRKVAMEFDKYQIELKKDHLIAHSPGPLKSDLDVRIDYSNITRIEKHERGWFFKGFNIGAKSSADIRNPLVCAASDPEKLVKLNLREDYGLKIGLFTKKYKHIVLDVPDYGEFKMIVEGKWDVGEEEDDGY